MLPPMAMGSLLYKRRKETTIMSGSIKDIMCDYDMPQLDAIRKAAAVPLTASTAAVCTAAADSCSVCNTAVVCSTDDS